MKKIQTLLPLMLLAFFTRAQQQFDIFRFSSPAGWKTETRDGLFVISKTDNVKKTWCQIAVVKNTSSLGSIQKDFESEWNELASKQYNATDLQEQEAVEAEGWKLKAGAGRFTFQNQDCIVLLTTITGFGVRASILATTNSDTYIETIRQFLESIDLNKPAAGTNAGVQTQPAGSHPPVAAKSTFSFNTTNFDDGWNSVIQNDWVLVSKGNMKVYLFFAVPFDGNKFTGTGLRARDYYWDNEVSKYYTIQTKQYRDNNENISSLQPDYVEGWAVDKQTGERKFIAMRLSNGPYAAYITLAVAPDDRTLYQLFPTANSLYSSDLGGMDRYNKFAVAGKDILGRWENSNTNAMQWYYTTPSGYESYAGMTVASTSAIFNFNPGGDYTSIHNGATGSVGNLSTFQQNYKGKYSVTNWKISATNRWDGKTEIFDTWFVAIRGGRILKMQTGAITYSLVKTK